MRPIIINSKIQHAEKIIDKLEEFRRNEQAFSQDYYISATEPLMQLEELLVDLRLLSSHWPKLAGMIEKERDELFHWARIGNGETSSDAHTIACAKGKTKGFAWRLITLLRKVVAAERPAETEQENETRERNSHSMGNKYNEQQDLAWEVNGLLAKHGVRKTFEDNLRAFSDWDKLVPSKTPEPSQAWNRLRMITERSRDEHIKGLVKELFGDTHATKTSSEYKSCLHYVRLSILHEKALSEDSAIIPVAEGVLDPEEVEITWRDMQGGWDSWQPVIKSALNFVQEARKPTKSEQTIEPQGKGQVKNDKLQTAIPIRQYNEDSMMPEEYRKKLIEAAVEIHKLLTTHRPDFEEKAQAFVDLFERWREAVIDGQRKALEHRKPELAFNSRDDIPPEFKLPRKCKLYKLYSLNEFYTTKDEFLQSLPLKEHNKKLPYKGKDKDKNVSKRRFFYFGPPLPRNPMDTLRLKEWPFHRFDREEANGLYEREPEDRTEDLLRKFFLLACIHAFYSHGQQPIIDSDCLAAQLVYEAYYHEDDYRVPDKQALVETALFDVHAYIEQGQAESKPQKKAGQDETYNVPTFTEDEANVLDYLNNEHPQIRYQQDIVAACDRDRKTIQRCLKKLLECKFVSRPEGKKKGYVITSTGKDYLNKYF